MVIRIDGKSFTKFSKYHDFKKPNDENALQLMNISGKEVMKNFKDIIIGYG
jgi:tRNA(His) guanylyltransferase